MVKMGLVVKLMLHSLSLAMTVWISALTVDWIPAQYSGLIVVAVVFTIFLAFYRFLRTAQ